MFIANNIHDYWDNRFLEFYDKENIGEQVRQYFPNLTDRDWEIISECCKLDLDFLEIYNDFINWDCVSENPYLTEEIIEKYTYKLNWDRVCRTYAYIDDHFWRRYNEFICSVAICENPNVSYKLIHKHAKDLSWYEISWVKWITTEDFIREFKDYVNWDIIVKNECELSESFIREFIDYFDILDLVNHRLGWQHMKGLLTELKDEIDWEKYLDKGYSITTAYLEVYNYWRNKNKEKV